MGVDDNRGEKSINRVWPESANDGGYTDAPTETGSVSGPPIVRRSCDLPTTDVFGWFGDRASVWSETVVPPRLRSGYGQQLSLERTQFVTKTPKGLSMVWPRRNGQCMGKKCDVLLGSETMAGLTSSTSLPTDSCPRHWHSHVRYALRQHKLPESATHPKVPDRPDLWRCTACRDSFH